MIDNGFSPIYIKKRPLLIENQSSVAFLNSNNNFLLEFRNIF